MTKTVDILGAGSSACARGPLVSEFKEASFRAVNKMRGRDGKEKMLAAPRPLGGDHARSQR